MAAVTLSPFPGTSMTSQRPAAIACIRESIAGGSSLTNDRAAALGETAAAMVERFSPDAPGAVKNEAVIRVAGWMHSRRPNPLQSVSTGEVRLDFRERFFAPDALRNSGARSLLTPWRTRRALPVADAIEPPDAIAADAGTTIMRCGFANVLPHRDSQFRWIGTVNGVEIDSGWTQPASFAFWIPGDLIRRVVAVILLRSVDPSLRGVPVHIGEFGPAEPYTFGATAGMIRYTPTTFVGRFAQPNDFRAVLEAGT